MDDDFKTGEVKDSSQVRAERNISETKKALTERMRENPWMLSSLVLGVVTLLLIFTTFSGGVTGNVISEKDIGTLALDFFNSKLSQTPGTLGVVKQISGLYEVDINIGGELVPLYFTKDGNFVRQGDNLYSIIEEIPSPSTAPATTAQEVPKSDKPSVELYVMSFCPYGVRAENNILPIVNLLKDKIDLKIRYIVNAGTSLEDSQSLHGVVEANQDAVQLVINKLYPDKFLTYLVNFNEKCYPLGYSDAEKLNACWKSEASKLGMDVNKIVTNLGTQGVSLLKIEEESSNKVGASGSPTLIINGVKSSSIYSGTQATQEAICGAFNNVPSECSQTVSSSDNPAPAGSC